MADWNKPTTSSNYNTEFIQELNGRLNELATLFDGATPTNLPTNTIRFNSSTKVFEKWNGTTWSALDTGYALDAGDTITGQLSIAVNHATNAALKVYQTGAGDVAQFGDSADPDTTPTVLDTNGRWMIGHTASIAHAAGLIANQQIFGANTNHGISLHNYQEGTAFGRFNFVKSRNGSLATPTVVVAQETLGGLFWQGYDGSNYRAAASIVGEVDGTPGASDMPGRMVFSVTLDGANAPSEAMRISQDKSVLAKNSIKSDSATAGIGYATGAGGTVTQATSRSTGVTLNKVSGAITLVSAAGSTSWTTFTLTNSAIAATDTVEVVQKSGTDKYLIHVTAVAAGSCAITFATTGGTTTEQPVFQFNVMKGVNA